ncbi:MAG TPA: hypothetical protein ENN87_17790 [Phycisphaerales bacterium]|nr:hypothetical protein [Phycisphaerales bacterium]
MKTSGLAVMSGFLNAALRTSHRRSR